MPNRVVLVHSDQGFVSEALSALSEYHPHITAFTDPLEALGALQNAEKSELLIVGTEFAPGKPHGIALARMVRMKRPDTKVIFLGPPEHQEHANGLGEFMVEPISAAELAAAAKALVRPQVPLSE